jgi:hypothetical protein
MSLEAFAERCIAEYVSAPKLTSSIPTGFTAKVNKRVTEGVPGYKAVTSVFCERYYEKNRKEPNRLEVTKMWYKAIVWGGIELLSRKLGFAILKASEDEYKPWGTPKSDAKDW